MILVFGKTGQVASELRQYSDVVALGRDQADLSEPDACADAIRHSNATVVINAAAYTNVDGAETDETLAHTINCDAPAAMAHACADKGVPFLHISTDYVFDGTGAVPWCEGDPANPINAYGRSKLAGEKAVAAAGGAHAILRTSWVFSAHGRNFVKTMLNLSETKQELSVVNDQIGGPTPAADIASVLVTMAHQLGQDAEKSGIYHFSGQPQISWAGFATDVFRQANRSVTVNGIPMSDFPTRAERPLNSRLDCTKIKRAFGIDPPDWQAGLEQVLTQLEGAQR